MNPIIKLFVIASIVALIGQVMHSANAMYEDQVMICNFEDVCQIVNVDDYMSRNKADKLYNNFNQDLDTFDVEDYTDGPPN